MLYTAKYIGKTLDDLIDPVQLPSALRGEALLKSIQDIQLPPLRPKVSFWQQLKTYNYRPALAYAAAFAVIVGAFYGFGFNVITNDLVGGNVRVAPSTAAAPEQAQPQPQAELFSQEIPQEAQSASSVYQQEPKAEMAPQSVPVQEEAASSGRSASTAQDRRSGGIGGPGKSQLLKTQGEYDLYYRNNDRTDPDKENTFVTVELIHSVTQQAVCQLSIPGMDKIRDLFLSQNQLAVVGSHADRETSVRVYDLTDMTAPQESYSDSFPGQYATSGMGQNVLYLAACGDAGVAFSKEGELIVLPGADQKNYTVLMALQTGIASPKVTRKVVAGGTSPVYLSSTCAYVTYQKQVAEITLEGLDMQLGELLDKLPETIDA
ncbi:beta-propeller domain-containing protein [Oscillospiraceae bacterium MB08-C2-2]|nr:beta-propeller domain-containing protein [Oscillospiraceae bacterium MB08-C2-2]